VNYKTEDFVAEVKSATNGAGANVILDMVGGDYVERNYDAAAIDGRIVPESQRWVRQGHRQHRQGDGEAAQSHRLHAASP